MILPPPPMEVFEPPLGSQISEHLSPIDCTPVLPEQCPSPAAASLYCSLDPWPLAQAAADSIVPPTQAPLDPLGDTGLFAFTSGSATAFTPSDPVLAEPALSVLSRSRLRQPLVFHDGNLRVWLFPSKTLQDLSLPSDALEDSLWQLVYDGSISVGCAVHVPPSSIPTQICRPDGSCGLQFAALALCEASTTWRPSLSTPGNTSTP